MGGESVDNCFGAVDLVLPFLLCCIIPYYFLILTYYCYIMAYTPISDMEELTIESPKMDKPICQIITPVGMLGYGFDERLTYQELTSLVARDIPTAIILDSGSTDSGPQKLALGSMTSPRSSYVKDLSKLLKLVHTFNVPLIFASAGGDGTDEHVRVMEEIIEEITEEDGNRYVAN
jgi:hypothetical protein